MKKANGMDEENQTKLKINENNSRNMKIISNKRFLLSNLRM